MYFGISTWQKGHVRLRQGDLFGLMLSMQTYIGTNVAAIPSTRPRYSGYAVRALHPGMESLNVLEFRQAKQVALMVHVQEINDLEALAGLTLTWNYLLGRTPRPHFFQSHAWVRAFTEFHQWRAGARLRLLVVRSGGDAIGILPLIVQRRPTRLGCLRVLAFPTDDWGHFYGPIGRDQAATWWAALGHLRDTPRDWDLMDLRWMDRDGTDGGRAVRAMTAVGFQPSALTGPDAASINLEGAWDAYWSKRSQKLRSHVRQGRKRLAEMGPMQYVRYRPLGSVADDSDPRWDLYDGCTSVAQKSWQGNQSLGNTISHGHVDEFLRHTHLAAAQAGALDVNLLYVAGRPAAFAYNYVHDGNVSGLRMGYDPAFEAASVGKVLFESMLADSFNRGDRSFDLGPRVSNWKRSWMTDAHSSVRYCCYRSLSWRSQLVRLRHALPRKGA